MTRVHVFRSLARVAIVGLFGSLLLGLLSAQAASAQAASAQAASAQDPGARTRAKVVVAVLPFRVNSARPLGYLESSLADLLTSRLEASG